MSSDFWAKAIGGIARPPAPQAPAPQQGAWWQEPQPPQAPAPQQQGYPSQGYNPALQAQMPYGGPTGPQGMPDQQYINQLKSIPADQLNQEQMETIAKWELENKAKYNSQCPQCGSSNFVPAGTVIGTNRMGTDKCFDCGASSSTYTSSPEPARGGATTSKAPYRDVRQIDTGGGAGSMYLQFNGVPSNYIPRGA